MNETLGTIRNRRSIRSFKEIPIEQKDLETIVLAGLQAPSGKNRQSARLIAVTEKATRDAISEENRKIGGWEEGFDPFYGAPAIIIALFDKSVPTGIYDATCAMENMMLAAESLGLGSIWIHRAKEEFESDFGKDLLKQIGLEGEYEGVGHVALGYPDTDPKDIEIKEGRAFYIL